jgi:transketolase N-terminal domain/subunit
MQSDADLLAIDTIRTLSMDAVQKANSGHPGTPMALAPVMYTLWQEFLRYDPEEPAWNDRDRFVLSCGHASMLLYATLHLAGVKELGARGEKTGKLAVSLEEIQRFRQLDSKTPGHPEHGVTTGVETTTGPLGQGVANSVGMAIAQRWLAARYGKPGHDLFTWRTWALCSDGDLMEGVGSEAASIAGHLGLSRLCWIYDQNRITIEGRTDLAFTEDVATRFQGYGWNTIHVPARLVGATERRVLLLHVEHAREKPRQAIRAVGQLFGIVSADRVEVLRQRNREADVLLERGDHSLRLFEPDFRIREIRTKSPDPRLGDGGAAETAEYLELCHRDLPLQTGDDISRLGQLCVEPRHRGARRIALAGP